MNDAVQDGVRIIQRLQQSPQAFPHPVADVPCIETHISWVLLAGEHAYKFKKPLKLDFLDYSTLALRRAGCEEELRINRRTAPDLYLGVVAVTGSPDAPRIGGTGPVLDWAVHMRRFDQAALFSHRIEQQQLLPRHVDALAAHVAAFHEGADVAPPDGAFGQPDTVLATARQNLSTLSGWVDAGGLRAALDAVTRWTVEEGERLRPVFAQRLAQGRVRECHGDLHLGNLVLIAGAPQLFDAIEFNPALRWIDVMADVAFLAMDLQARGRADLAWRFLNGWLELTGDYAGLRVLAFYLAYRAMVRAKVAAIRLGQTAGADREAARHEMARYLNLAAQFTMPRERWLWLASGVSGSGKSSQSQALIEARGVVRLRADVERKRLFGLPPEASSAGVADGGIYTAKATRRTYDRLAVLARAVLDAGLPVLVDATFLRRAQRDAFRALARERGVPGLILAFDAPEAVLRERVRQRAWSGKDVSEAGLAVLDAQLASREPLDAAEWAQAVAVDTTAPVDWPALLPVSGPAPPETPTAGRLS
jgi:uncharacterized protein